jgi:hypothetical protein
MARRSHKPPVVFLTGTLTEFTGNRDQPHALFSRPVLFLLGPAGSGKTTVARHYFGNDTPIVRKGDVFKRLVRRILTRSWKETELCDSDSLILEIPSTLGNKPQITKLLTELINERTRLGMRTAVLDSEDNASLQGLLSSIDSTIRANIVLRFPEGKGRYRFLAHRCREKNIPLRHARRLAQLTPWTYKRVLTELENLNV